MPQAIVEEVKPCLITFLCMLKLFHSPRLQEVLSLFLLVPLTAVILVLFSPIYFSNQLFHSFFVFCQPPTSYMLLLHFFSHKPQNCCYKMVGDVLKL